MIPDRDESWRSAQPLGLLTWPPASAQTQLCATGQLHVMDLFLSAGECGAGCLEHSCDCTHHEVLFIPQFA